jgi:hypothetical protein
LPYKHQLFGLFTNINGLSRNLHPFWDWIAKFSLVNTFSYFDIVDHFKELIKSR